MPINKEKRYSDSLIHSHLASDFIIKTYDSSGKSVDAVEELLWL